MNNILSFGDFTRRREPEPDSIKKIRNRLAEFTDFVIPQIRTRLGHLRNNWEILQASSTDSRQLQQWNGQIEELRRLGTDRANELTILVKNFNNRTHPQFQALIDKANKQATFLSTLSQIPELVEEQTLEYVNNILQNAEKLNSL